MFAIFLPIVFLCFIPPSYGEADNNNQQENNAPQNTEQKPEKKNTADTEYFLKKPYFRLSPFFITIFEKNNVYGTMRIDAIIKTTDKDWYDIRLKIPSLYHHIFVDLYQSLNYLWDRTTTPNYKILKKRFMHVIDRILGPNKVENVMIGLIHFTPKEKK